MYINKFMNETTTSRRSRSYVFTCNNYTPEHISYFQSLECRFIVYGIEEAPSTGTKHLQGYVQFESPISMKTAIKRLKGSHIELAKGTPSQCITYCEKDGLTYRRGEPIEQGERSDITQLVEYIGTNPTIQDVQDNYGVQYLRFHSGIERMLAPRIARRTEPPKVWYVWGSSGTGKTRSIYNQFKLDDIYVKPLETEFWTGYRGQRVCVIDDFRGEIKLSTMLRLLDRYPYQVKIHYGLSEFNSEYIIITSNLAPHEVYDVTPRVLAPFMRRLENIFFCNGIEPDYGNEDSS